MLGYGPNTSESDADVLRQLPDLSVGTRATPLAFLGHDGSMKPWMLDEVAFAGPEHLDPSFVAAYDRKSGTHPAEDIALLGLHGLDGSSTLVDLGAGTGRFALAVAGHCGRVWAVDVSPAMVEHMQGEAGRQGITNVSCIRAGILSYEHEESSVDFVYTRNALHHMPDFWKAIALQNIADLLRPGGVLLLRDLIYDVEASDVAPAFAAWFDGATTDTTRGYTAAELAEHVRSEHSTFRWLLEPMITRTGLEIVDVAYTGVTYGRYVCVRPAWSGRARRDDLVLLGEPQR